MKKSRIIEKNSGISSISKTLRFNIEEQNVSGDAVSNDDIHLIEYEADRNHGGLMTNAVTRMTVDTPGCLSSSQVEAKVQKVGQHDPIPAPYNLQKSEIECSPLPRWSLQSPSSSSLSPVSPCPLSVPITVDEEDQRSEEATSTSTSALTNIRCDACIFKVYDDCRQDALVIQVSTDLIESTIVSENFELIYIVVWLKLQNKISFEVEVIFRFKFEVEVEFVSFESKISFRSTFLLFSNLFDLSLFTTRLFVFCEMSSVQQVYHFISYRTVLFHPVREQTMLLEVSFR